MRVHQVLINRFESKNLSPKIEHRPQVVGLRRSLLKEQLSALATDVKNGRLDQKETTSRFIDFAAGSLKDRLSENAYKKLLQDLTEVLSEDPEFSKSLTKNLNLIS